MLLILHSGSLSALRMHSVTGHLLRSLVGVGAMFCFFYAYARMPLAEVIAISFAAPLFVVALSVPLLGEPVGPRRWAAVLVGFVGVMIMLQPGPGLLKSITLEIGRASCRERVWQDVSIWVGRGPVKKKTKKNNTMSHQNI